LPVFRNFQNCVLAVRAWFDWWDFIDRYESPFTDASATPSRAASKARAILADAACRQGLPGGATLSEHASKQLLRAYGIKTSRDVLCASARAAVSAASEIGFPVVMKVCSPDLAHKSDAGLVLVGVGSAAAVRRAYDELLGRATKASRSARIEGVLVCDMVSDGVETLVGVSRDDLFGPVVTVGLGGVLVEVLGDVAIRVPPFGESEARAMIDELAGRALLLGVRGANAADENALIDVIMKVQRLAMELADDIAELDINPLVVRSRGAVALDALVVRRT
jgi:acyl-CoA synthetase (NDP forming)